MGGLEVSYLTVPPTFFLLHSPFFSRSHSSSHTGPSADQLGDRDRGKVETGGADYRRTEDLAPTGLQPVPEQRYTWAHSAFACSLLHMLNGCLE